jgi:hypothetical protein
MSSLLGLSIVIAVHLGAKKILSRNIHKTTLLNFIAGIAMAYAFVDVFPHLAKKQPTIDALYLGEFAGYLSHHLYFVALIGFCVFVVIRVFSMAEIEQKHSKVAYSAMIISMSVYALIIGYMLAEQSVYRPETSLLFGLAMAAHFLGLHHELSDENPVFYQSVVRYLLAGCSLIGWCFGLLYTISEPVYAIIFAYITGGIVAVGAISDLPRVQTASALIAFLSGALVFSVLLLAIEAFKMQS